MENDLIHLICDRMYGKLRRESIGACYGDELLDNTTHHYQLCQHPHHHL